MATTLPLEQPSTTVLDNNIAHSEAKTSSKLNTLHVLVSELKKALPKHLKGKRKQASASSEGAEGKLKSSLTETEDKKEYDIQASASSEGEEGKLTSSPTETEDKKEDEIIEIQSPTSLNSTKPSNHGCLPLKNFVLKRKQASPEGQGLESKLPSPPKESTQSSSTKMTNYSWLSLKNIVPKRKQALPLKEVEEKQEEEEKPEEEQKSPCSTCPSSTTEEEEQKSHSSSDEKQHPSSSSSSTTKEQEHQKAPSFSATEEKEQGKQKPPSSTTEDPSTSNKVTKHSWLSLKNILPPKIQQAVSSKGHEEKLPTSLLEEKLPGSSEDAIKTQPPKPSKSTQTICSFFSVKNIVPKRKQALSSKELEEKLPSSGEAIHTTPSSSEQAPAVDDKQKPPSEEEEQQQKLPFSTSEVQEPSSSSEEQKPPSSKTEDQEQQKSPSTTEEQKPPSSTSEEVPSNSTEPPSGDDKHLALQGME